MDSDVREDKWGWVVASACFCMNFIILGLQRSAAIVYVALLAEFGITREQAAWPITLCSSIMFLVGPLAGFLSNYLAIRTIVFFGCLISSFGVVLCYFGDSLIFIMIFFGAVQGFGNGLIIVLNSVIVNQYFKKHKATATGVAYAGASVGSVALPPLTEYLLSEYGLRGCLLLLGGIIMQGLVAASLYRPPRWQKAKKAKKTQETEELVSSRKMTVQLKITDEATTAKPEFHHNNFSGRLKNATEVLTHPSFLIICLNYTSFFLCYLAFIMVFVDFIMDRGMSESEATFCISAFSIGDLFGRLFTGWLSDFGYVKIKYLTTVNLLGMGVFFVIFPLFFSYTVIITLSVVFGVLAGCVLISFPVLMAEHLGLEHLAMAMGFGGLSVGVSSLALPNIIGLFRDTVGTYDHLFHLLGVLAMVTSLLWLVKPLCVMCKKSIGCSS